MHRFSRGAKNILIWKSRLNEVTGEIPMILLANKSDLTIDYAFTEAELQSVSSDLNATFFLTSAKFGDNVIKAFYKIGELVINKIFKEN